MGEAAGVAKGVEAGGCGDEAVGDDFAEDRGKEDGIGIGGAGLLDFAEGVAGDGDDGGGEVGGGVALDDLDVTGGGALEADVDAVGAGRDGGVERGVDDEDGAGGALENAFGKGGEDRGGKVLFTELDDLDSLTRPEGGLLDEGVEALMVVAGKGGAVGDGAAEHVDKCSGTSGED